MLLGSIIVIYEALQRILSPEKVLPEGMLGLAILGITVNSIAAYKLSKDDGMNTKMVMYHLLEDLLGWIAVLIVSIILIFKPWYILDSILSILISLVILRGVYKNLIKIGFIFLQRFPDELELEQLKEELLQLELVEDIHAAKGWSIDDTTYYLRFHVLVPKNTKIEAVDVIKINIRKILGKYNIAYSTIEFESTDCCDDNSVIGNS